MQDCYDLTIVLTIKDRVPFTYRWMQYMNDIECPYKILIADGGADSAIEQHLRNHGINYPYLNCEYVRYPYDATHEDYYKKFENILSLVESEYLLLADNDDFYLLERIPEILAFLDAHNDYVGARGQLVNLTLFSKTGVSSETRSSRYAAVSRNAVSIDCASPFDRVENLCRGMSTHDYYANWYCVFRAEPFHDIWKSLVTLPIKEMIVLEVLVHVLMTARGKIKITSKPFYIRQSHTSLFGDTLVIGNEFLERCIFNNTLSGFGLAIDQFFTDEGEKERHRLVKAIAAWFEVFVTNIYLSRLRARKSFMFRLREKIKFSPQIYLWLSWVYFRVAHHVLPIPKRSRVRLKVIERYILSCPEPHERERDHEP